MTYASKKLAEALKELSHGEAPRGYTQNSLPSSLSVANCHFPPAVAQFIEETTKYSRETKTVSVGIY